MPRKLKEQIKVKSRSYEGEITLVEIAVNLILQNEEVLKNG